MPRFLPPLSPVETGVDKFQVDQTLLDAVGAIRNDVRKLFEELRLKHLERDIPGKERLERVPALAKRNFANLTSPAPHLAVKEAWRLVDFLEDNGDGRLSALAREGLRLVELDKKLAARRASDLWQDTAERLRRHLGVGLNEPRPPDEAATPVGTEAMPAADVVQGRAAEAAGSMPAAQAPGIFGLRWNVLTGGGVLVVLTLLGAIWWSTRSVENPFACLALEQASGAELARHRVTPVAPPLPRPPRRERGVRVFTISDPPGDGPVQSTWTTSQFSFAERTGPKKPGGGKSDLRLRVGGWGDTYLSLLRVPLPSDRLAHKAVLQLTVLGDAPDSRPTSMSLRAIGDDWRLRPGSDNRLWWKDCPTSEAIANNLPPPGPRGSVYEIDITDLYNMWAGGLRPPYGILLEPENIGSWGPGRPHYANFSTFYSTRARDSANRPRLILTY